MLHEHHFPDTASALAAFSYALTTQVTKRTIPKNNRKAKATEGQGVPGDTIVVDSKAQEI